AVYRSSDVRVVTVNAAGQLLAVGNGDATVTVAAAGMAEAVPVKVSGVVPAPAIGFSEHIIPILTKAGCNAAACHASQHGKGGFNWSVSGFAREKDHYASARDGLAGRITFLAPSKSLWLLKPTGGVPQGGGRRLPRGSVDYEILPQWILRGAPPPAATLP